MTGCVLDCGVDANALLVDYLDYVAGLSLSGRAVRDRARIAREFLSRNPDLGAWMMLRPPASGPRSSVQPGHGRWCATRSAHGRCDWMSSWLQLGT